MLKPFETEFIQCEYPLETLLVPQHGELRGVAILNHPNPLQGGTNTNKVIQTAAKALSLLGVYCYLPNSRGTGKSGGHHDYGQGETIDTITLADIVKERHGGDIPFILGGFSFGGYVSACSAPDILHDGLLLIAPAVSKYSVIAPHVPDVQKTLVVQGSKDEVITPESVLDWCEPQDLPVTMFAGVGHFFHGKLIPLQHTIGHFFSRGIL